ncbi:histidine kinase [Tistrella bauzanensis]|uniref:Histidine kinase n=1 Tax=Tistrella bauzanensis TaxID=657419 RepID=A0ABQ1J8X6_9PROT|nr:CBS domain-containing protein [Tistrella bauzanensis]GGB61492.1 histidine kinase [Tistrella bauzanensis]
MLVEHILRRKGRRLATVDPQATIARALEILAHDNIGALPVVEGDTIIGMISERDVARGLVDRGASLLDTPVSGVMSTRITTCRPDTNIDDLMTMMTERRIRHVPVLDDDGSLAGMVSIGDAVKSRLDELETEAQALRDYVAGVQ